MRSKWEIFYQSFNFTSDFDSFHFPVRSIIQDLSFCVKKISKNKNNGEKKRNKC